MAQKYVGLDLGTHEVKAVLLSAGMRSVQILEVIVEPVASRAVTGGDEAVGAALEVGLGIIRRRGWNHYPVGVALPGAAASFRVLKFPFADSRRIAQAIAFEAEGQFPIPLEDLEFDHIPVPTGTTGQALMVAVRRELLDRINAAFKAATVDLKLITIDAIATAQVLDPSIPELVKTEAGDARVPAVLLLDIGHHTTDLVALGSKGPLAARVLRRGGIHVTRALAEHYRLDPAAAEQAKHDSGFLPHRGLGDLDPAQLESGSLVARAIEPIVREVEHTRLWLRAEFGAEITQIRISGGGARLRGLDAYLAEQIGLPVIQAQPRSSLGVAAFRGQSDWSGTSAALGAAIGCARRPLIQLRKDVSSQRGGDGSWLIERMSTIAALGFAILALAAVDTMVKISALESELAAREDELGKASEKVFGEALVSRAKIEERLNEVDGEDITAQIADRGAVEVLAAFIKATVPAGPKPAAAPAAPTPLVVEGEGEPIEGAPPPPAVAAPLPAVDMSAGISWDDDFEISQLEIRPRAIVVRASATRSSAQDRLETRLRTAMRCLTGFQKARVRDENQRKVFDPTIDHDCYYKDLEGES